MFEPNEMQRDLIDAVSVFVKDLIGPTAEHDDAEERFRKEYIHQMGEQGLCGIATPEEYGGLGLGYLDYAMVLEEIAKVSASYAVSVAVTGLPQVILNQWGNEDQKQQWLPALAAGEHLGAFCLSEAGSGSDAASLKATAVREGDEYVLNGSKYWVTHGGYADVYMIMARTGGPGPRGISCFLVPGDAEGLSTGRKEQKMGMRASPTTEIVLDNVRIPAANLVGNEGDGFKVAMTALDSGRITIASIAVGTAQAALDVSGGYACERKQFGKPIIDFQGVGFMLADMATAIETSRMLVHKAAWLKDNGRDFSGTAAMAKVVATDAAMKVTTDAVQVMGGYGYCKDHPVERFMRDAKIMQIFEGTNQVQRIVISRHLKKAYTAPQG